MNAEDMSDKGFDERYGHDDSSETLLPFQNTENQDPDYLPISTKSKTILILGVVKQVLVFALAFWGFFNIAPVLIHHHSHEAKGIHGEAQHTHSHSSNEHALATQTTAVALSEQPVRKPCSCGKSVKEAIAMGCVYDSLSPAWLQPHCHDHELVKEFETLGDGPNGSWLYWRDRNHTIPMTIHEVSLLADVGEARFHISWEWHVQHCAMYWIKLWRSGRGLVQMEGRYDNENHIRHCVGTFTDKAWGTASGVVLDADLDVG